jgi:hypothetical protein
MVSRAPLTIVVLLGAGVWALSLVGNGWIVPASFFAPVSIVVSALSVLFLVWDAWLWRLGPIHPWPVARPDLRGTWRGEITRADEAPIVIFLVVEQSYWDIHLRTFTAESRSASVAASLARVEGQFLLASLYRNEPRLLVQDRSQDPSRPHYGATRLSVLGSPPTALDGAYWTDRETKGELRFERMSREIGGDFADAERLAAAAPPPLAQASPRSLRSAPRDRPRRRAASD